MANCVTADLCFIIDALPYTAISFNKSIYRIDVDAARDSYHVSVLESRVRPAASFGVITVPMSLLIINLASVNQGSTNRPLYMDLARENNRKEMLCNDVLDDLVQWIKIGDTAGDSSSNLYIINSFIFLFCTRILLKGVNYFSIQVINLFPFIVTTSFIIV